LLLNRLGHQVKKLSLIALAHPSGPAIGQIGLDRPPPGRLRGFGLAGGAFEILQDRPSFPGLRGVAIGLKALDRPSEFLPGFVVAAKLSQNPREVAADLSFVAEIL